MYNEKLEALITAALADGVLTDKEKNLLFKKAEAMGIDRDEFELVLEMFHLLSSPPNVIFVSSAASLW